MKLFNESGNRLLDIAILSGFLLIMAVGLLVFGSMVGLSIINDSSIDHVSGAWIALAMDLRDGIFYRPLYDESIGYGGTRFFPLFFSLIALVSSVLDSTFLSGYMVAITSGLLLLMSCYLFMRRTDVKPLFALALCVLLLSAFSIRFGFQSIRGDLLPLALNIFGLAVYLDKSLGRKSLYLAVLLFVLAFSAKVTAIHGAAALFLWLMLNRRRREAGEVLLLTSLGYIVFLGFLYVGTSGRVFEIFEACASGGATIITLLKAPISFSYIIARVDPVGLLILFWAIFLFFYRIKNHGVSLPAVFLVVSLTLTVMLYGSPGITFNHLVDITAASVLFIAYVGFSEKTNSVRASTGIYMVLMLFVISRGIVEFGRSADQYELSKQHFPEQLVNLVKGSEGIVLSEDPGLPVFNNMKPFLLDPFMLRLVMRKDEEIRESVINEISNQKYRAIIFMKDPVKDPIWYANAHFGDAFMDKVFEYYQESGKVDGYVIYQPI